MRTSNGSTSSVTLASGQRICVTDHRFPSRRSAVNTSASRRSARPRQRRSASERPSPRAPAPRRPFGVAGRHGLDLDVVADEQGPDEVPVPARLRAPSGPPPTSWRPRTGPVRGGLPRRRRRRPLPGRTRRLPTRRARRSPAVLLPCCAPSFLDEVTDQVEAGQLVTDAGPELLRVRRTSPAGVSSITRGVPAVRPARSRTSAGTTMRPLSPTTTVCVPRTQSRYHDHVRVGRGVTQVRRRSATKSMQCVSAATSSGSMAGYRAMRSWLRPSLR